VQHLVSSLSLGDCSDQASPVVTCVLNSPPEDEHNSARNMLCNVINVLK